MPRGSPRQHGASATRRRLGGQQAAAVAPLRAGAHAREKKLVHEGQGGRAPAATHMQALAKPPTAAQPWRRDCRAIPSFLWYALAVLQ
jgi:hypothetical protein